MTYLPQLRDTLIDAARAETAAADNPRRPRRPRLVMMVIGAIIAIVVPAAAAAVTGSRAFDFLQPGQSAPQIDDRQPPIAGRPPSDRLMQTFGVLRRARSTADAVPAERSIGAPAYFADQSHRVSVSPPTSDQGETVSETVYVAGGFDDRICLIVVPPPPAPNATEGSTGVCQDVSWAIEGKTFLTLEQPGGSMVDIFGVVPDGVVEARLQLVNGQELMLPVRDNIYSAAVPSEPHMVSYTGPSGAVQQTVGA